MKSKIKIAIIIVTFNSEKYIAKCLASLKKNVPKDIRSSILVLDNDSNDKTKKILVEISKTDRVVTYFSSETNKGFAKSINKGLKIASRSDYYLLLNPDTVTNKNSISKLLDCAIKNKAGIVGGSTYGNNGKENGSYFRIPNLMVGLFDFTNLRKILRSEKWHNYFYYLDQNLSKNEFPVDVVTGGYMLISKNTIKKIGFLDERYFMYLEDVDYCRRAKLAGIKIMHTNNAWITHHGGGSSQNKDKIRHSSWLWSRKIYYLKNFGLLKNLIIQPVFLLDDIFILLRKSIEK